MTQFYEVRHRVPSGTMELIQKSTGAGRWLGRDSVLSGGCASACVLLAGIMGEMQTELDT